MIDMKRLNGLNLVVVITNLSDAKKVNNLLKKVRMPMNFRCHGEGTASSEFLDMIGFGSIDKAITLMMVPKDVCPRLFKVVSEELNLRKRGRGIVFSVPISGVSGLMLKHMDPFVEEKMKEHMERKVNDMKEDITHGLVLAIVNRGFSEDVMEAAAEGGANGGTILHVRRLGTEEAMQLWGINIQSEKEIIAILATKENRLAIMKAISKTCGIHSEAKGMVLSLPVDGVMGLEEMDYGES